MLRMFNCFINTASYFFKKIVDRVDLCKCAACLYVEIRAVQQRTEKVVYVIIVSASHVSIVQSTITNMF